MENKGKEENQKSMNVIWLYILILYLIVLALVIEKCPLYLTLDYWKHAFERVWKKGGWRRRNESS